MADDARKLEEMAPGWSKKDIQPPQFALRREVVTRAWVILASRGLAALVLVAIRCGEAISHPGGYIIHQPPVVDIRLACIFGSLK